MRCNHRYDDDLWLLGASKRLLNGFNARFVWMYVLLKWQLQNSYTYWISAVDWLRLTPNRSCYVTVCWTEDYHVDLRTFAFLMRTCSTIFGSIFKSVTISLAKSPNPWVINNINKHTRLVCLTLHWIYDNVTTLMNYVINSIFSCIPSSESSFVHHASYWNKGFVLVLHFTIT